MPREKSKKSSQLKMKKSLAKSHLNVTFVINDIATVNHYEIINVFTPIEIHINAIFTRRRFINPVACKITNEFTPEKSLLNAISVVGRCHR